MLFSMCGNSLRISSYVTYPRSLPRPRSPLTLSASAFAFFEILDGNGFFTAARGLDLLRLEAVFLDFLAFFDLEPFLVFLVFFIGELTIVYTLIKTQLVLSSVLVGAFMF